MDVSSKQRHILRYLAIPAELPGYSFLRLRNSQIVSALLSWRCSHTKPRHVFASPHYLWRHPFTPWINQYQPSPYKSVLPPCLCLHVQHTVNNHNGAVIKTVLWYTGDPYWWDAGSDCLAPRPTAETEWASIQLLWVPVELKAMPWTVFAYWLIHLWK